MNVSANIQIKSLYPMHPIFTNVCVGSFTVMINNKEYTFDWCDLFKSVYQDENQHAVIDIELEEWGDDFDEINNDTFGTELQQINVEQITKSKLIDMNIDVNPDSDIMINCPIVVTIFTMHDLNTGKMYVFDDENLKQYSENYNHEMNECAG